MFAVAKRTSMFDDPAIEIQELTAVIKEDITALNSAIADLHALCSSQSESGSQSKQSSEHSVTVVDNLKSRLMSTTKEFKEVLTMRTEVGICLVFFLTLKLHILNCCQQGKTYNGLFSSLAFMVF